VYQIKPAFQEFTEKFPNVILYEKFSETLRYTFHSFRESAVFSGSLEVVDLRFVPRKILRLINVEWKTNPNYLSGNFRSRLSYQCQHLKELFERILKIQYRNNILDVFINQLHDDDCLWIVSTRRGYSPHSRGDSSLLAAIFHDRSRSLACKNSRSYAA
jgi:hypothetical protein